MTDFETQALADLCSIKVDIGILTTQMDQLMGINQPGRIQQLERRVSSNEHGMQRMKGFAAAFGTALTMVHLAISYFATKHN